MAARATSKITSKSQVTVPARMRDALGRRAGDSLVWTYRGDGVVEVAKQGAGRLEDLIGMLGPAPRSLTVGGGPGAAGPSLETVSRFIDGNSGAGL